VSDRADTEATNSVDAFAFYDLRDAVPVYVALAFLLAADATVDNTVVIALIVVATIMGMFAAFAYVEAGDRGAKRRRVRERFDAALDAAERKARRAAAGLPLGLAIVSSAVVDGGLPDFRVAGPLTAVFFLLSQVIFALWLNARHARPKRVD
jgi:hypothetical protein